MNLKKKYIVRISLGIALLLSVGHINAEDVPVYYLNLCKGNVTMTPSSGVTGFFWNSSDKNWGTKSITKSGETNAIYHICMVPDGYSWDGNPDHLPAYTPVTTSLGGSVNIVNNTDVNKVIGDWATAAANSTATNPANPSQKVNRPSTGYSISVSCNTGYTIVLDNIWSTYQKGGSDVKSGGLSFNKPEGAESWKAHLQVILKGDNRLGHVAYQSGVNSSYLIFTEKGTESDGNFTDSRTVSEYYKTGFQGTLTVADIDPSKHLNHYNSVIGGCDDVATVDNLVIKGGTVFAGATAMDECTAIGAGGNGKANVTIEGGTVTAVTSSTGTAIGGGIGWGNSGGPGTVTISGGEVYAYNLGILKNNTFVHAAAIGGGSSADESGATGTVTITGGTVYAQSVGGVAIGGGGSSESDGGGGNVTISGGTVTAKSIADKVPVIDNSTYEYIGMSESVMAAESSIGGGIGGKGNGGAATINISGGAVIKTGSIGGGSTETSTKKIGTATVTIGGGTIQGQFIMAYNSSTKYCNFTMTGGTIDNSAKTGDFVFKKDDGGAVWMDDTKGTITVSGGTISGGTALNGGAVYMTGGTFNMNDGSISGNTATANGGAVYLDGSGTFNLNKGTLSGNRAVDGGAIYMAGGKLIIKTADIENNTSSGDGGALYVSAGTTDFQSGDISGNTATSNGGGVYVAGGTVTFSGNLKGNTAMNGGGLYLASQAIMTFKGGIISGNSAVVRSESGIASTAYNSGNGTGNVEGCGGGIYLDSGAEGHVTSLNFNLSGGSFGLYSNLADKGGDDLVSEGIFTSIVLPDVSEMSLAGFEGKDANPDWYEDYFTEDTSYDEGTKVRPSSIERYRVLLNAASDEFSYHRIPLGTGTGQINPTSIANKYLSLTLGYQSLKFTLKVTGLVGEECAKFLLRRHGAEGNNTDYDLLFSADDDAENPGTSTKVFANMAWGDYSILPVESWNWAYDPVTPVVNIHIANTWEYEHTFEMKHKNNSQIPLHEEHNVAL